MVTLSSVKPNMQAQAAQIQRINNVLNGVPGAGVPVKLTELRSADDPALTVRNKNSDGVHFRVLHSNPLVTTPRFEVKDTDIIVDGASLPTGSSSSLLENKRVPWIDFILGGQPTVPTAGRVRVWGNIATGLMNTINADGVIRTLTNDDDFISQFSGASIYKVNTQNIPNNTPTTLTFSGVLWDRGSPLYANATTTDRLGIGFAPTDPHRVRAVVYFDINGTGIRTVQLTRHDAVGNVTVLAKKNVAAVTGVPTVVEVEATYIFSVGDYITVDVTQTSGVGLNALNAVVGQNPASMFEVILQQGIALATGSGSGGSFGIDYVHQFLVAGV